MTLVACGSLFTPIPLGVTSTGGNSLIDANDERAWSLHSISRSGGGNIARIHFRTNTVTTGDTVDIRIETVNASGQPSGTLWATNTNVAQLILLTDDNLLFRTATLTASATVAIGDTIAIVLKLPSAAVGNMNITRAPGTIGVRGFPYSGGPLTTDKVDQTGSHFAIEYDDGVIEFPAGTLPGACTITAQSMSSSTNPDEAGILFTAPFTCRVVGWWAWAAVSAAADFRIALYASGNNTPLATSTMDGDFTTSTGARMEMGAWDDVTDGITLTVGSAYRLAAVMLTTTASNFYRMTMERAACFDGLGLPGAQRTVRNRSSTADPDTAAWTEVATERFEIGLIIDQIDNGVGGAPPRIQQVGSRVVPVY